MKKASADLLFTEPTLLKAAGRVWQCGWGTFGKAVSLVVNAKTGLGGYQGVKRCNSVWLCPECSARIAAARAGELAHLLHWSAQDGLQPVMLTLTFRHDVSMPCKESLDALKSASVRIRQGRPWDKRIKPVFGGSVVATETTYGVNGWHHHHHMLLLIRTATPEAAAAIVETMRPVWAACLRRAGRDGSHPAAFQVQNGSAVSAYISKLGAEIALATSKTGRDGGRTPLELLAASVEGDTQAGRLWLEYARSFHGTKALCWSHGLKAECGLADLDDDDIDDVDAAANEVVRRWQTGSERWREARRRRLSMLTAAEEGFDLDTAEYGPTDYERWRSYRDSQTRRCNLG